ncbi:MAG: hypothetical protein V1649_04710 [Patescibacteria group bacterium]
MTEINKEIFEQKEPEISERERERERERESNELSKKSLEIFEEKLNSIKELEKPEKVGSTTIIKEADAIIYQIQDDESDLFGLMKWIRSIEIGLGDLKDRKRALVHYKIEQKIKRKLNKNIITKIRGLLWINENKELNISLEKQYYRKNSGLFDNKDFLKYFQEMLERYQIKKLWVHGEEKNKEISERIEKLVWDAQSSAYAEKQGMTTAEFMRWRLIGSKLGETGKEK